MREKWLKNNERAVSETVGFVIILGIVMSGIGLVTLYGYPALLDRQADANIKNMEKTLIVLQTDINSLAYKNVPYQETAIQVSGGTLSVAPHHSKPFFNITVGMNHIQFFPGKLRFISEDGGTIVVLENGAVIKRYPGITGSVMIAEPRWYYDSPTKTLVITLINITGHNLAQAGIGTISMQLDPDNPPQTQRIPTGWNDVYIRYENDHESDDFYRAWELFFDKPDLNLEYHSSNRPFYFTYRNKPTVPIEALVIKTVNITVLSL